MTRILQHLAVLLLASTLLPPLLGVQAEAAPGLDGAHGVELAGLQLAEYRLDNALAQPPASNAPALDESDARICTTTCGIGPDDQGELRNYCVTACANDSREISVKALRGEY